MEHVDLSDRYLPWPAPGDWEPFIRFSDNRHLRGLDLD
jgi:hypothetical protein